MNFLANGVNSKLYITYMWTNVYIHAYLNNKIIHTHVHILAHMYVHAFMYTNAHIRMHTCTYTHVHTKTHIHTVYVHTRMHA